MTVYDEFQLPAAVTAFGEEETEPIVNPQPIIRDANELEFVLKENALEGNLDQSENQDTSNQKGENSEEVRTHAEVVPIESASSSQLDDKNVEQSATAESHALTDDQPEQRLDIPRTNGANSNENDRKSPAPPPPEGPPPAKKVALVSKRKEKAAAQVKENESLIQKEDGDDTIILGTGGFGFSALFFRLKADEHSREPKLNVVMVPSFPGDKSTQVYFL
jgi:hypothetical protein